MCEVCVYVSWIACLQGALGGITAYKLYTKTLPRSFPQLLPMVGAVLDNLESPWAAYKFSKFFNYSSNVTDAMVPPDMVPELRQLYNFLRDDKAIAPPVFAQPMQYLGILAYLHFMPQPG